MPNWTNNNIVITGEGDDLEKFMLKITDIEPTDGQPAYHLTNCMPRPKIFKNVHQGARTFDDVRVDVWFEDEEGARPMLDITKQQLVDKYGTYQPVDWEYKNWGTKWGDCQTELLFIDDNKIVMTFDSAWGEPFKLLNEIGKKYNLKITNSALHEFEEEPVQSKYPLSDEETKELYAEHDMIFDRVSNLVIDPTEQTSAN